MMFPKYIQRKMYATQLWLIKMEQKQKNYSSIKYNQGRIAKTEARSKFVDFQKAKTIAEGRF